MVRVALVINSLTEGELSAGNVDTSQVHSLLMDRELGCCDSRKSPRPFYECKNTSEFLGALQGVTVNWDPSDQLIFYFSGHGENRNGVYCIKVGLSDSDYLPFSSILEYIRSNSVIKAIFIIDSCFSGHVTGEKYGDRKEPFLDEVYIPKGLSIISSSSKYQKSNELDDGSGSVFTHLMCMAIKTGLDGNPTSDGFIYAKDIVSYVKRKLDTVDEYKKYIQRPRFKEIEADNGIWIARNISGTLKTDEDLKNSNYLLSQQELEFAYRNTTSERLPCEGATIDEIDWDLVYKYAQKKTLGLSESLENDRLLVALGLFAHFPPGNRTTLHKPAVLCFCRNPEHFYPQAKSLFVVHNPDDKRFQTEDICGPLSHQFERLFELAMRRLETISEIGADGLRHEEKEIPDKLVRELISNAIAHRDYDAKGGVEIRLTPHWLEVRSPGTFKEGITWDILTQQTDQFSDPVDPAITLYLKNLLVFEQIGRGFDIIRQFIRDSDSDAITYIELPGPTTLIRVRRQPANTSDAESLYLSWIINQHRYLNIAGLRTRSPVEVELERVYISLAADPHAMVRMELPEASGRHERPGSEDIALLYGRERVEKLDIAEALNLIDLDRIFGLVILGGPGTGKTTVLKYLTLAYARGLQSERLNQSRALLPIFITLRSIMASEFNTSLSESIANSIGHGFSPRLFERKLRDGNCLVLLDGLDEVIDEHQRRQVARWIVDQRTAYSQNPFIITCRDAGFREEYLPPGFLRLDIRDFDEEEVTQFARNWYLAVETTLQGDSDAARRRAETASEDLIRAIRVNERVRQLAVNPLMLSIIALVHRYRATLPADRVALYNECVDVLLGHWDEAKDLPVSIPPGRALQVLQSLALWLHEQRQGDDATNRMARRDEIASIIAEPLASIGMSARDAEGFLDSVRYRSGLVVEYYPDMFGFQHQTFQEYLAALEIAAKGRLTLLLDHFGEAHWREVTLLYAGSQDATDLLDGILHLPDKQVMTNWPLVMQIQREARAIAADTRQALAVHPFVVLQRDPVADVTARAAIYTRLHMPDIETLLEGLTATDDELIKGHLILLLADTGDASVIETLQPLLTDARHHLRYLAALALDILGFENRQTLDDLLMVTIPVGEFTMGSEQTFAAGTPRRISTASFQIDRFPLTNGQYRHFIIAGGYQEPQYWSTDGWRWKEQEEVSGPGFLDDPRFGVLSAPVVGISWYEAEAYAHWAGKCLPTEQEWERATRGDQNAREFPWGDTFEAGRCNTRETGIGQTTPVGSYPNGISPYGCYDMAGNVWEWTSSLYEEGKPARVLRGGSWHDYHSLACCSYRSSNHHNYRNYVAGVRFCRTL